MSVSQQTETPPCHEDPWPPGPLARRERRAIPGAVCEERATKPAGPRAAAQRGASRAKLGILDDVRHRLRRGASHLPARRSRQSVHIISLQTLRVDSETFNSIITHNVNFMSIGFSDTWRVRRAAPGTRSSRARQPGPEAIPCHEFQRRPLEHSANLDPKLRTLPVCPSRAPNVARIRWGERIFQKRGSLNLLSGPQNRVSLPNKVGNSAGLSRLSVALEIECPIVVSSP